MARFDVTGLEDLIKDMERMALGTSEQANKMLLEGAEEVADAWRAAIKQHDIIDRGTMLENVGYPREPKMISGIRSIDIYPQGMSSVTYTDKDGTLRKRKTKIRNAEKAFMLHYGTRTRRNGKKTATYRVKPTYFVDDADRIAGPKVEAKLKASWDAYLKKHNL